MIKTIKTTKKLDLPELIHHVWENKVFPSSWRNEESPSDGWTVQFFEDGMFRSYRGFHDYDTFTVEIEEEITEDTIFEQLVEVRKGDEVYHYIDGSINEVKDEDSITFYVPIDGELVKIWQRGEENDRVENGRGRRI